MDQYIKEYIRMLDVDTLGVILDNKKCDEKCQLLHAGNCNMKALIQLVMGAKSLFKVYLLAHIIPLLLFKFKKLKKNPIEELKKTLIGLIKSLLFAGCSTAIIRRLLCLHTKYISYNWTMATYPASVAGVSILFESPSRQIEISLYCFAKGWETAYLMLKRRNLAVKIPWGNLWMNGSSLALIAFFFMNHPEAFREGSRKFFNLLLNDI